MGFDPKKVQTDIREGCIQIAHLRGIDLLDSLQGHATECAENLRDSRGTTEEAYWSFRLQMCDELVAGELTLREGK